jgi:hypothetical protein
VRTLCNGTKTSGEATVQDFTEATVITGYAGGKDVFITQTPQENSFRITRIQLPIRLPSLKFVRHHLKIPCFAHKTVVCWLFERGGGKTNCSF